MCVHEKEWPHRQRCSESNTHCSTPFQPFPLYQFLSFSSFLESLVFAVGSFHYKCSALWAWTQVLHSGTVWNKCIVTYADMSDDCTRGHMKHAQDRLRKQTWCSSPVHSCTHWSNGPVFGVQVNLDPHWVLHVRPPYISLWSIQQAKGGVRGRREVVDQGTRRGLRLDKEGQMERLGIS